MDFETNWNKLAGRGFSPTEKRLCEAFYNLGASDMAARVLETIRTPMKSIAATPNPLVDKPTSPA